MLKTILLTTAAAVLLLPARSHALDAVRDNVDDLPDDLKKEYVQGADGKWTLQVTGMKPQDDFTRLQRAHDKEKGEHTALKARFAGVFGDKSFEDVAKDLDRLPELEAAAEGKLDEDKINSIVEGRVRTKVAPLEREIANLKQANGEKDQQIGEFKDADRRRTIKDAAREAATKAKLLPEAVDDFLLLADNVFEVREDDGKVVVKDKVGFTPGVDPSVLLTDLQSKRPHWWGPSQGGGAGGAGGGSGGTGANPFTFKDWNMTAQGQLMNADPQKADQLARAAGHKDAATARKPAPPAA